MLMNSGNGEAKLHYGPSTFKVLGAGKFVRCAVSGEAIRLEELRYWSAEYQEAYATCEVATKRLTGEL
ncbi:DUF2093 domain-containing protein [Altererythrobacter sp.]|uniref:DUF2093 domain-containing protein n=1 Tax=Altererythrobacter sp. TaxID=1872480 RepID=UPI001B1CD81A|nr:DUF2093 domain-containing protein [Altererythrobacter sp.]MBO6609456.1 DUF2093 domain-containing protein [Altererythrobacter sp.]MBO6642323.1 DUF2093 domain-containing protein [Altererythrobacter sp.]MBO6709169.1 DUF2093 domain-containing protein [Altererythrobacter sp.]MBO6944723.1 DUF2093 domain-containing protein [Altererythrobacter sp.]